jgi:hypothetical protein
MAENKKSFVAYCDWQETFEELSDEEAGKLVKHLFNYVNDKNPETSDKLTKMCFIPIKQSLKRDLKKYEGYIEKQSINGKKGGRPKNPTLLEITQPFLEKPKKADSVSVNDINIKSVSSPPDGVDHLHFYIAKTYHTMFYAYKGSKSLEKAEMEQWVNTVRLLLDVDKVTIAQLIAVKHFLQAGIDKERGVDTFWSDTIYSISSLRKKSKDGIYQFDRIKQAAKKWIEKNPEKENLVYKAEASLMKRVNGE